MNQQAVEEWIARNGGAGALQYNRSSKRVRNPSRMMTNADGSENPNYDPTAPEWIDINEESWTNSKTGSVLRVSRRPDGDFDIIDDKSADPNKPTEQSGTKEGDTRGPQNGPTREVFEGGKWTVKPNPLYQQDAQKPSYITSEGTVYEVYPGKPPKPIIQNAKPGQVVNVGNGRLVRVDQNGQATVVYDDPRSKPEQDKDGQWYVTEQGADGKPTVRYIQPQGQSTGQGPALPVLVLGQVQSGLRAYKDQLNREVASGRMTPTVADKRWKEATELGGFAIQEAQTFQRDEESRRNADVNLRTNAMSNAQSGFNSALSFVQDLNSKLPEGSTAGGAAFEAILGLQQLHARRMGAYDNPYSGPNAPRSPQARGIDVATAATVGTTTTTIGNVLNKPPEAAPAPAPGAPAPAVQASAAAAPPPAMPSGPRPVAPAAPAPAAPAPAAPPMPAAPVAPAPPPVGQNPDAGQALGPTGDSGPLPQTAPGATLAPPPASEIPYGPLPYGQTVLPLAPSVDDASGLPPTVRPTVLPEPGVMIPGTFTQPAAPADAGPSGGNVMMAPGNEFAALAQFNAPAPASPRLGAPDAGPDMVALRRAQIASTPPWQLDNAEIEWAMENGFGEDVWAMPRRIA